MIHPTNRFFEKEQKKRSKFRFILSITGCLATILILSALWHLLFIDYPLTKMTDIEGVVTETRLLTDRSPYNMKHLSYTYYLKLEPYHTPLRLESRFIDHFSERTRGFKVTVQIMEKDLAKIKEADTNISLNEITTLRKYPRIYGIATGEDIIIAPAEALRQAPTPLFIASILYAAVIFATGCMIFRIIRLCIRFFRKTPARTG
jgi:hypothetical protein